VNAQRSCQAQWNAREWIRAVDVTSAAYHARMSRMQCIRGVGVAALVSAVAVFSPGCASAGDAAAHPSSLAPPREGSPLPSIVAHDLASRATVSPDSLRGRVVLLDFWASWCVPCKQSIPFYQELAARHAERGFTVVGVSVDDTRELAERFVAETQPTFPMWWDEGQRAAARLQLSTMPTAFLIDRKGVVQRVHVGFVDADRAQLETAVEALLAQQ
jgi:cytochrome c biogenesis protein CcmG, thiol:disulfide interchange protein DsbE